MRGTVMMEQRALRNWARRSLVLICPVRGLSILYGCRRPLERPRTHKVESENMTTYEGVRVSRQLPGVACSHIPILENTRAICSTKLNSRRPDISLAPFAACSVFDRSCAKRSARLVSS